MSCTGPSTFIFCGPVQEVASPEDIISHDPVILSPAVKRVGERRRERREEKKKKRQRSSLGVMNANWHSSGNLGVGGRERGGGWVVLVCSSRSVTQK